MRAGPDVYGGGNVAVRSAAASKPTERPGLLLDLVTGAETDLDSVQRLAKAGANTVSAAAGTTVDCPATLTRQQGSLVSAGSAGFAAEIARRRPAPWCSWRRRDLSSRRSWWGEAESFARVAPHSMKLALEVRSVRSAGDNGKAVLESRTSIDVACGVIITQNRCSYADAFSKFAGSSRQRNLKVRSVAQNILKAINGGSPATRSEPPVLA